jgi:hypothetical protein
VSASCSREELLAYREAIDEQLFDDEEVERWASAYEADKLAQEKRGPVR